MGLEFFTGFEGCNDDQDVRALFDAATSTHYPGYRANEGYNNGKCLDTKGTTYDSRIYKKCINSKIKAVGLHTRGFGVITTPTDTNNYSYSMIGFNGPGIYLWNTNTGIQVSLGTTSLATFGSAALNSSVLQHIQIKVYSHATEGYVEVWLNNTMLGREENLNTGGQDITSIQFGSNDNTPFYDDIYISDQIEGELTSRIVRPSADYSTQFTPSTGTDNYAMISENTQDNDTTYNKTDVVGNKDIYEYDNIADDIIIKNVSVVTVARRDGADQIKVQLLAIQDSTEYNIGSEIIVPNNYPSTLGSGLIRQNSKAPDNTDWNTTKFNGIKWGTKLTEKI